MCVCPIVILTWGRVNSKYLQDFSDFVYMYRPHGVLSKFRSVYLLFPAWKFILPAEILFSLEEIRNRQVALLGQTTLATSHAYSL
jgi:hypothetical protein